MPLSDAMTTGLANPLASETVEATFAAVSAISGLPNATPAAAVAPAARKSRRDTDMIAPSISVEDGRNMTSTLAWRERPSFQGVTGRAAIDTRRQPSR